MRKLMRRKPVLIVCPHCKDSFPLTPDRKADKRKWWRCIFCSDEHFYEHVRMTDRVLGRDRPKERRVFKAKKGKGMRKCKRRECFYYSKSAKHYCSDKCASDAYEKKYGGLRK